MFILAITLIVLFPSDFMCCEGRKTVSTITLNDTQFSDIYKHLCLFGFNDNVNHPKVQTSSSSVR